MRIILRSCGDPRRYAVIERMARCSAAGDGVKETRLDGRQEHLDDNDVFALAHVDMHVERAIEAEADAGPFRKDLAELCRYPAELVGYWRRFQRTWETIDASWHHINNFCHGYPLGRCPEKTGRAVLSPVAER